MLGTDMTSVGRSPAYSPAIPSCLKMDTNVDDSVPISCLLAIVAGVLVAGVAVNAAAAAAAEEDNGNTHSMRPLFRRIVEPHS